MGAADIVPGVSGGTVAFILGIYQELVDTIASVNKKLIIKFFTLNWRWILKNFNWKFLVALFGGIFIAILSLAHLLEVALQNYPTYVWSFFMGLILASVPLIIKKVSPWNIKLGAFFGLGILIALLTVNLTPQSTPNTPLFLIFSGAMASMAMILPGISGSFILVLLGKYQFVLRAVNTLDFLSIALIGIGAVMGLIFFSKLISKLLTKYHNPTVAVLGGFVLGAITKIWPFKTCGPYHWDSYEQSLYEAPKQICKSGLPPFNNESLFAAVLLIVGALTITALSKLATKKDK